MPAPPFKVHVLHPPGSSQQEIADEPDWHSGHNHRIGYRNKDDRVAGFTHDGEHMWTTEEEHKFVDEAMRKYRELREKAQKGELVNFQEVMEHQTDFYRHRPDVYPPGWRFMVRSREDWVKYEQDWPANIKQREKKEEESKKEDAMKKGEDDKESKDDENDWRRQNDKDSNKHHGAYGSQDKEDGQKGEHQEEHKTKYQKLLERYSPQEISLLHHLQDESEQAKAFQQNDGKQDSPVKKEARHKPLEIDAVDARTPDNWIPSRSSLIRRTGQHPLNGESRLESLFSAGLITPNELHYVRNHGPVPRLYWDQHMIDVCDGALRLSMDDLERQFEPVNIPVALACDGNRRGELNAIKKSKGFDWGPGAVSCAYWKGALLYEVLEKVDVKREKWKGERKWINFEGADELSEGKYATSIPLDYALDRGNDVLLAYEMNNTKLPADHGYPVRLLIPGFVGGRSVKWLAKIWISDHENDSHYHIWDNRVLPPFITEMDGEFARTMFNHPSTACMEQNLNSVIVRPGQGLKLNIAGVLKNDTFKIEGYAYDGGGHEVQRVEVSLDEGRTWLYCIRRFPDRPVRNGNKFWTWIHWFIDVDSAHLVRAPSITVRCFNVFKNTQPERGTWNLTGMMNNGWYAVKSDTDAESNIIFRHPVDFEGDDGWMKPSTENQLAEAKQDSGVPDKQFTRQEIEKHNSKDDLWLVVNGNVYDATSVLSWHPGGAQPLIANAGRLSMETTANFESIHDEYAHKKLRECAIGRATHKAMLFMQEQEKTEAAGRAKAGSDSENFLQSKKWVPVKLIKRKQISEDTFTYSFEYDHQKHRLGLGTCQHILFGIHMPDKMLIRPYTPTRPITERDEDGTFDLTVKTYFPDENQPGGAFSNFLHTLPLGEFVDVCGANGEIKYKGKGKFKIEGQEKTFKRISLVLGGSGITPGYSLLRRIFEDGDDNTQVRVIDANKTEGDILLYAQLNKMVKDIKGQIQISHVLSHPKNQEEWKNRGGLCGHVNTDMIKKNLFEPSDDSVAFLCGPPAMIQKSALPALTDWGYKEDENCFGF
ncbi:uncharacterized protein A1O9_07478 [Exophiala aquamarina CBS 119918]|uniref:Nitrate reductase [NADPH] n=1 Tax=Exophiala aquamarina CBS 119918 TaxID=1182545 RepID=A0A072P9F3_9EURO|nr:uncharacterized protein A1O9_07478 [Exophiala aquamarina CBS 119918]KEF55898.1 hypothetical protein A1O9_07478 [Exophiala aquamarina CBS 119918]